MWNFNTKHQEHGRNPNTSQALLLGPEAWAERLRYTMVHTTDSVTQLRAPTRPADSPHWPGTSVFSQVKSWMQMMCPQCPPRNCDFSPASRFVEFTSATAIVCGQMTCASWSCCPSFCSLRNCRADSAVLIHDRKPRPKIRRKAASVSRKYDWRIFSMPTGIHPLSFPHKPCQSAPTKTLPLGILHPSMLARLGLHEKSLRMQCIYKYTKFHVYTQLLNIYLNISDLHVFPIQNSHFQQVFLPKGIRPFSKPLIAQHVSLRLKPHRSRQRPHPRLWVT